MPRRSLNHVRRCAEVAPPSVRPWLTPARARVGTLAVAIVVLCDPQHRFPRKQGSRVENKQSLLTRAKRHPARAGRGDPAHHQRENRVGRNRRCGGVLMYIPLQCQFQKESQLRANETTERTRAEALFKKQEQPREGAKAVAEYETAQQAIREKTARLRALRLERDAAKQAGSTKPGAV
jgi:hypothetical protein